MQYSGGKMGPPVVVEPSGTFMLSEIMNHGSSDGGVVASSKKVKTMASTNNSTGSSATSSTYSSVAPTSSSSCASVSPPTVTVPFLSSITPHPPSLHGKSKSRVVSFCQQE